MKTPFSITLLFLSLFTMDAFTADKEPSPYFYQLKIYHLKTKGQEIVLDKFLESAWIPAMKKAGIGEIGVFKPIEPDTADYLVYVLIPFKSLEDFSTVEGKLQNDKVYLEKGKEYINAIYQDPPYSRIESILMRSFKGMPSPSIPKLTGEKSKRVYELRSYESATEKYYVNKVHMFNEGGEIEIFDRLGFNAVFYAEVISGTRMPNLMYMTSFHDRADRDARWKAFREDAAWIKLSGLPEYQKNVSKADIIFLYPTEYSGF